ncbi:MAG TPA: hypothetical protein PLJ84_10895 [Bacteroidales bacterium]|nr:hypothetical protein [Bacteroidales bacterium]
MKSKILSIIILFAFAQAEAQDFLIGFAGSGSVTTVDSVKVQNLVQGTELTLNGLDILNLTEVAGIEELTNSLYLTFHQTSSSIPGLR